MLVDDGNRVVGADGSVAGPPAPVDAVSVSVPAASSEEAQLRRAIELLYFAYRDFTTDADVLLARYQFGRAHHRVIYFVGRNPGMGVGDLLALLRITKQSLAPVLAQLVEGGFIVQRADAGDRRRRRLYLSAEAAELERRLTDRQATRIAEAYAAAGPAAADGFCRVLMAMINPADRARFDG